MAFVPFQPKPDVNRWPFVVCLAGRLCPIISPFALCLQDENVATTFRMLIVQSCYFTSSMSVIGVPSQPKRNAIEVIAEKVIREYRMEASVLAAAPALWQPSGKPTIEWCRILFVALERCERGFGSSVKFLSGRNFPSCFVTETKKYSKKNKMCRVGKGF